MNWSIDYYSTALCTVAFSLIVYQWVLVVQKAFLGVRRKLFTTLKIFMIVVAVVIVLQASASTPLSCLCDGNNCPYQAPDYNYWISWQVLNGISIIASVTMAIIVLRTMPRNNVASERKRAYQARQVRFTLFVVLVSCCQILLLGYTITLFVSYAENETAFLTTETLEIVFIFMILVSVLITLSVERKEKGKGGSTDTGSSASRVSRQGEQSMPLEDDDKEDASPAATDVGSWEKGSEGSHLAL